MHIVRLRGKNVDLCVLRTDEETVRKYVEWMNDEKIIYYLGKNKGITSFEEEREWLEDAGENTLNIITKPSGKLIGNVTFGRDGDTRNYGLGICIGDEESRDKGYGTEVISMLVKHCFEECNAHRVFLRLLSDNKRGLACYKKCGFKETGRNREVEFYNGKFVDEILMDILEDEYFYNIKKGE